MLSSADASPSPGLLDLTFRSGDICYASMTRAFILPESGVHLSFKVPHERSPAETLGSQQLWPLPPDPVAHAASLRGTGLWREPWQSPCGAALPAPPPQAVLSFATFPTCVQSW